MKFDWVSFGSIVLIAGIVSVYFALTVAKIEELDRQVKTLQAKQNFYAKDIEKLKKKSDEFDAALQNISIKRLIFKGKK